MITIILVLFAIRSNSDQPLKTQIHHLQSQLTRTKKQNNLNESRTTRIEAATLFLLTKDNNNSNNIPINDNIGRNNINMVNNRNKYYAKTILGDYKIMSNNINKVKRK